jgi:hypothetical protein
MLKLETGCGTWKEWAGDGWRCLDCAQNSTEILEIHYFWTQLIWHDRKSSHLLHRRHEYQWVRICHIHCLTESIMAKGSNFKLLFGVAFLGSWMTSPIPWWRQPIRVPDGPSTVHWNGTVYCVWSYCKKRANDIVRRQDLVLVQPQGTDKTFRCKNSHEPADPLEGVLAAKKFVGDSQKTTSARFIQLVQSFLYYYWLFIIHLSAFLQKRMFNTTSC